jgi:transposase InsO family protein
VEEVESMSATLSTSCERIYGVARVCAVWEIPRSTLYDRRGRAEARSQGLVFASKRGPKTALSDPDLVARIRGILEQVERENGWRGEGYRKVHARLRFGGVRVCRRRVLRLMRENALLAPTRAGSVRGPRVHDGKIVTELPDVMWGTDATTTLTTTEDTAWVFAAIDHCTGECVGIHASKSGTRFEALEPVIQGVGEYFGSLESGVAAGLALRHDHGSQYMSDHFQVEIRWLGIESSPSFVRAPEGNGVAERFMRTLKEQLLWVHTFRTIEELLLALQEFRRRYNATWILGRHGYRTPAEVRRHLTSHEACAA